MNALLSLDDTGITPDEIRSRRDGTLEPVSFATVNTTAERVEKSDILERLTQWREEDNLIGANRGGRPKKMTDLAVLTGFLLLAKEKAPLYETALAQLFQYRLDENSLARLGLKPYPSTVPDHAAENRWRGNVDYTFKSILALMDPYPYSRRRTLTFTQVKSVLANHDSVQEARRKARLDEFTNRFLHMTYMLQNRATRRAAGTMDISIDQTAISPINKRGWHDKYIDSNIADEQASSIGTTRRGVVEVFAGFYPEKSSTRPDLKPGATAKESESAAKATKADLAWLWTANIAVRVNPKPDKTSGFPHLIMGGTLSLPNIGVSEEAVKIMSQLVHNGHKPGMVDADQGYFAHARPERLHDPTERLGFKPSTEYRKDKLGVQGGAAGADQIEGHHYCPAMGKELKEATIDYQNGDIDLDTYRKRIQTRIKYRLRAKEKPDHNGNTKMLCPAAGKSPTMTCPLKQLHPDAADIARPEIDEKNLPEHPDRVCTKTCVTIKRTDGLRYKQALEFGSEEWYAFHKHARNSIEGVNSYLKDDGKEQIDSTKRRLVRGFAAAQFFLTVLMVNYNIRTLAAFVHDQVKDGTYGQEHEPVDREKRTPSWLHRAFHNAYIGKDGTGHTEEDILRFNALPLRT
ncbi:hypothetical protein [Paramicrobacterium agarici]|uniref:hypothetical protein n=1 Tax=Paramicrobacterium agarici TaxID=630514 RepID=UPI0011543026|nr:hypothetical protein [Microbacterium agarici]TQO22279.1 dihydroorotase [Microbacterium agarici]